MKNKSAHHKSNNIFKFQSFSERISTIDVDIFHRVTHRNEDNESELHESFFYSSLNKWEVLNLSENYSNFRKEVKPQSIVTLPQVVYEQERIVTTLINHLQFKNALCLQPLLEHVVGVCKDLRVDFYQYYSRFFSVFLNLLNTKDAQVLEWTFHCLAYLFKVLWRPLIRDIDKVFVDLLPLLSDDKPDYINNFAAESFAFVARKVRDRKSFLHVIIKCVKSHKQGYKGCGQLFFYTVNGINGLLHSYSEILLPFLINSLTDYTGESQDILFHILEELFLNITSKIHPQKNETFWKTIETSLDKFIEYVSEIDDAQKSYKIANLNMLLTLIGSSIEFKNGKFLNDTCSIIQPLLKIFSFEGTGIHEIQLSTIRIVLVLLNSSNIKLQQEHASKLTLKILSLTNKENVLYFIDKANKSSVFDTLILPIFLKMCINDKCSKETLHILTKLIMKKSKFSFDGIHLAKWRKYSMNISQENSQLQNYLTNMLNIPVDSEGFNIMDNYICATICLPHIPGNKKNVNTLLCENVKKLCDGFLAQECDEDIQKKKIMLINFTLQALIYQEESHLIIRIFDLLLDTLLPFCQNRSYLIPLRTLDLLFTCFKNDHSVINMKNLEKVHEHLENNFNSAYSEIRLLTAHIYSIFEILFQDTLADTKEPFQIFTICYKVESISPQLDTYRDQLNLIENLSFDKPQASLCRNTKFAQIPLRYLCGILYFNFKLLWDPVIKVIISYAHAMTTSIFWHVFGEELKITARNLNNSALINGALCEITADFLNKLIEEGNKISSKPDYANHRLLLWKAMDFFPSVAEAKTKDISELFLNFFEEECTRVTSNTMSFCNIKQNATDNDKDHNLSNCHIGNDDVDENDIDIIENILDEETMIAQSCHNKFGGKIILKTLLQHLSLFSKIRSPLSMYREAELHSLYMDLLSHRNHNVQKLALSCLLCYKSKHLSAYTDNLYKLIDPNSAKNELTTFRLDLYDGVVMKEHRATVVPIIIRLALSKLTLKVGGKGQNWRGLVVRFMGGCTSEEMLEFVRVTFRQYDQYLGDSVSNLMERLSGVSSTVNLMRFIHPKRLISTLNLIQVIFDTGGLLSDNILRFLLQILLVISSLIRGVYNQKSEIHSGYLPVLRQLKNQCQKSIGHFFEHFYCFPFLREELLSIYLFSIWPYIDKLPIEGVHSPTTLLHLLVQSWGSNPRFFPLLNILNVDGKSVMPFIMELLMNTKTNIRVVNAILDMVQRLLTLELDKVNTEGGELNIEEAKIDCSHSCNSSTLNYGSSILLPHAHQIMEKIQGRLISTKSKTIGPRDLSILSRLSELITEERLCNDLLEILVPICIRKCALGQSNEEIIQPLLLTIQNLLLRVKTPYDHLRKLSPLFGIVALPTCRKIICDILKELMVPTISQENCIDIAKIVLELNAYDAKWIDQPDFQRRLDGFKQINRIIETEDISTDMGILVIHNCYYLISIEKDISLRDNATNCIKTITPKILNAHPKDSKYIIDETLFSLIRASFKHKQDDIRAECIGILGYLARTCSKHHIVLRDLNILTNSDDPEVDFFENMVHLQVFRHGRALVKFCQIFRQQTQQPCSRSLTQFILPLTTQYLCNERYANKNNIVDGAIDAVSVICRLLPWHQYEGLLKYYLGKLRHKVEYQKQLVRLIVAILDSFHFDLSKVQQTKEDIKVAEATIEATDVENIEKMEGYEDTDKDDVVELEPTDLQEPFEEDSAENSNVPLVAVERITTLCKSSATRIIYTIKNILLPQLHRALAELSSHEEAHKVNRSKCNVDRENDDLLRVPISLAVVKLLQKLPKQILDTNLPGVLMKLCSFLRSPLESVRRCTRETLQKIMISLGPLYLPVLLDSITPLLSKGFQSHVLVYTIHSVLSSLREQFKVGDIDSILDTLNKLCMADLFGALAEEKDVGKIGSKTSEAKSTKSFDTLQMLAQYLTESYLINLILPLKDILLRTHSHKIITKIQTALRHVSQGLIANTFVTNESLLSFSYGVSSGSIPQLQTQCNTITLQSHAELNQADRYPESCLIIPKAPERHSSIFKSARVTTDMNSYVLIEFGLNVCFLLLKRDKLREEQGNNADLDIEKIRRYLDPFVIVFESCLTSNHVKLCTITMQCLNWVIKYDLPSMKDNLSKFVNAMFSILHKYAAAGLSRGDNFDLVLATFKTVSTFLRHSSTTSASTKTMPLSSDQLALLLMYVEQDLHSSDRQATAFHLLRAILARRPSPPPTQLHDVILKTAELSIRSELAHVRSQARACVHQYMIEFPIGKKKVDSMIGWYVNQLSYDLEPGRLMVIETLDGLIYAFPQPVLQKYSGTLLMTLGARLINDDSPECRKNIATTITTMFKKLPKDHINDLFDIIVLWFKDDKVPTRQLAVQLISLLISVEKNNFEHRLAILVPIIRTQFCSETPIGDANSSGRLVRIQLQPIATCNTDDDDNVQTRVRDHYIFQLLKMLQKLAACCPKFLQDVELVDSISTEIQALLGHAHEWVRLGAAQFLGYVLATIDVQKLVNILQNKVETDNEMGYLYSNPLEQIKGLTLDLCAQLQPGDIRAELAEQIIKNLVFLAQVVQHIPINKEPTKQKNKDTDGNSDSDSDNEDNLNTNITKTQINLVFLTKRMRKIINSEIVEAPSKTTLRTEVFKWIGAICKTLHIANIRLVLHHLLAPLVRELNTAVTSETEEQDPQRDLRQLASEVAKLIKNRVDIELYTETVAAVQRTLMQRRAERKRGRTQLALTDPEAFAKKKIRRHEKKRVAKKRKLTTIRGESRPRKRRHINFEDNSDVM